MKNNWLEKNLNSIINEDCLETMKRMADKSVDLILTDPPYGTTQCAWDTIVPFEIMWQQIERIIKDNGAIIMTASQPFTTELIHSNIKHFRHSWIWDKGLSGNIFLAEYQPMKIHEDIVVFSKEKVNYYPIKVEGKMRKIRNNGMNDSAFGNFNEYEGEMKDKRNPKSILYFPNTDRKSIQHPTQKPVPLFSYLIKTYSDEGQTVYDPFMGSGTTAIACLETKRNFIGSEISAEYVKIAEERIKNQMAKQKLF